MGGPPPAAGKAAPLLAPQKFAGCGPTSSTGHLTVDQQNRIQEDLADRERQAAALASAGMMADPNAFPQAGVGQVLQAPPPLVSMESLSHPGAPKPPPSTGNGGDINMEAINWNTIP